MSVQNIRAALLTHTVEQYWWVALDIVTPFDIYSECTLNWRMQNCGWIYYHMIGGGYFSR